MLGVPVATGPPRCRLSGCTRNLSDSCFQETVKTGMVKV